MFSGSKRGPNAHRSRSHYGPHKHARWSFIAPWSASKADKRLTSKRARQHDHRVERGEAD